MLDVFIIGGGPVGLGAAIALRNRGLRVLVADGRKPPLDKACGEGLMPEGLEAARQLGLQFDAADSFPLRGIAFHGAGVSVRGAFPGRQGLGVRRTALHRALVARAEEAGVELRWGMPVGNLEVEARWIVGADGTGSRVRAWAGLDGARGRNGGRRRFGFRLHFRVAPWSDCVEVHWAKGCQIYITPVSPDEVGVALLSRDPKLRVREALRLFPALKARLEGAAESSAERGAITASRHLRRVTRGKVALIGDASGSVDAITGEGLSLGWRQGLALAEAIATGDLTKYAAAHRQLSLRPRLMAELLLGMDRWDWLRGKVLPAMAAEPDLFRGFLEMHVGSFRASAVAANCLALGFRMLAVETSTVGS